MWNLAPQNKSSPQQKMKKNKSHTGGKISHFHMRIRWGSVKIKCPLNGVWWCMVGVWLHLKVYTPKDTVFLLCILFYSTILKENNVGVQGVWPVESKLSRKIIKKNFFFTFYSQFLKTLHPTPHFYVAQIWVWDQYAWKWGMLLV